MVCLWYNMLFDRYKIQYNVNGSLSQLGVKPVITL